MIGQARRSLEHHEHVWQRPYHAVTTGSSRGRTSTTLERNRMLTGRGLLTPRQSTIHGPSTPTLTGSAGDRSAEKSSTPHSGWTCTLALLEVDAGLRSISAVKIAIRAGTHRPSSGLDAARTSRWVVRDT
jgi:hypothetical protein